MIWVNTIATIILFVYACIVTYRYYILKDKRFDIANRVFIIYKSNEYERVKWIDNDVKMMSRHGFTLKDVDTFLTNGRSIYEFIKDEQYCDETIKNSEDTL